MLAATATLSEGSGTAVVPNSSCSCSESSGPGVSCFSATTTSILFYTCSCTYVP
jgi:hypothetical protein